jgi:hypothetical protein
MHVVFTKTFSNRAIPGLVVEHAVMAGTAGVPVSEKHAPRLEPNPVVVAPFGAVSVVPPEFITVKETANVLSVAKLSN